MEHLWLQFDTVDCPAQGNALVLAPHPDDESIGCAGAMLAHARRGEHVAVVVATDGGGLVPHDMTREAYVAVRQAECRAACDVLGCEAPQFWPHRDRELVPDEALIGAIGESMAQCGAKVVYAPSPWEVHPDHRALCLAAFRATARAEATLVFYEVGVAMVPNRLLDMSGDLPRKLEAVRCYTSQLAQQHYDRHVEGLNTFRAYTLPLTVTAAEGYYVLHPGDRSEDLVARYLAGVVEPSVLDPRAVAMALLHPPANEAEPSRIEPSAQAAWCRALSWVRARLG